MAGRQHQSSVALDMKRLVKGKVGVLSISWWYVKARCPLGRDIIVKSRFWFHSRSSEGKFSRLHHARSLLG